MHLPRSSVLTVLSALAVRCLGSPADSHVIHEYAAETDNEWTKLGYVQKDGLLPVRIGLTQTNLDRADDLLMEISDPNSSKYGEHYTQEQVVDLFEPDQNSVKAVTTWLESEGISKDRVSRSYNKQWIQFDASVEELEKLLRTKYDIYVHHETGKRKIGADSYSIPHELQAHVDYITPAATKLQLRGHGHISHKKPMREIDDAKINGNCSKFITPHCIRQLYDVPLGQDKVNGNEMGIFELESYSQDDLSKFFHQFAKFIPETTKPVINRIDGARVEEKPSWPAQGEAMLDLEIAYPIIYPQNALLYSVDDPHYDYDDKAFTNGYFNTFLDAIDGSYCNRTAFGETGDNPKYDPKYPDPHKHGWHHPEMCGTYKPTNVISISWGPDEFQRTVSYDRRQCSEWMKLALQGVTVLSASGDTGVAGNVYTCIKDSDGARSIFAPLVPHNCPYIVAVGSTVLPKGESAKTGKETATKSFASGGGFSNIYPVPKWQKAAVDKYFQEKPSPYKFYKTKYGKNIGAHGGKFNRAGRATPDVAANGDNIVVRFGNMNGISGGTSASAPIFGAIINRINGERLKAGKSSVGFILPALYSHPHVLNDITEGHNPGCGTKGFEAAKGWDPVTGLGTPNYPKMLELFMSLP